MLPNVLISSLKQQEVVSVMAISAAKGLFFEFNSAEAISSMLETCSNMQELKQIQSQMFKTGNKGATLTSRALNFCVTSKSGSLEYAQTIFDRISRPDTSMYNAMMRGYSDSKEPEMAIFLYQQMLYHSVPHNSYTFPFLLKACSSLLALNETQQIHAHIVKFGFGSDVYATNSLIYVYAVCNNIRYARLLFDRLAEQDIVSWNSIIHGYATCGEMESAHECFKDMPTKNVVSWTTMISGYVGKGMYKEALNLFHEMQSEGLKPDSVALASTVSACANLAELDQGRWIHAYIKRMGIEIDTILGCVLIDMYAKCGSMEEAADAFRNVRKRDVSVWTAMISGFAFHGRGREAVDCFMRMQEEGIKPNSITFTAVLTACSYAGLVDQGKALFYSIDRVYELKQTIEHYGCMVDLLGRVGLLKEAEGLIKQMPEKPNATILGALLNACCIHRNVELGKQIGKMLIDEDPDHAGRFIQLASIFATAGDWNQAVEARRQTKDRGVSKLPGCSSICVNGMVHEFFAGDYSHPQMPEIYPVLDSITDRLKQEDSSLDTYDEA